MVIPRMYFNLFFVFLVSGFWHGANWTFIIWGALHGFYLVFALLTKDARKKISDGMGISARHWLSNSLDNLITFVLVAFAWIFFRANTTHDAFHIVRRLADIPGEALQAIKTKRIAFLDLPGLTNVILPCFGLILFLEFAHIAQVKYHIHKKFDSIPLAGRWAIYYAGLVGIFYLGVFEERQFIYFQF